MTENIVGRVHHDHRRLILWISLAITLVVLVTPLVLLWPWDSGRKPMLPEPVKPASGVVQATVTPKPMVTATATEVPLTPTPTKVVTKTVIKPTAVPTKEPTLAQPPTPVPTVVTGAHPGPAEGPVYQVVPSGGTINWGTRGLKAVVEIEEDRVVIYPDEKTDINDVFYVPQNVSVLPGWSSKSGVEKVGQYFVGKDGHFEVGVPPKGKYILIQVRDNGFATFFVTP